MDAGRLEEQVKSMMTLTENEIFVGTKNQQRAYACNVCGKESNATNIKTHIEAIHIASNISHSCNICGKISRSRNGLRQHKAKEHPNLTPLRDYGEFESSQIHTQKTQ